MDNMTNPPNVTMDLVRIHRALTRGLNVAMERGSGFMQTGFPGEDLRRGFSEAIQSLVAVLRAHHLIEDEVAFPAFKERLPSAPYARLAANHKEIELLLVSIEQGNAHLAQGEDGAGLGLVLESLQKAFGIWGPHIRMEEAIFSQDALTGVMSLEEQRWISDGMAKTFQAYATPAALTIPYVLYNLDGALRAGMAASLPANVLEELIPKVWQEQWAPMKPFLLD